MEMGRKRYSLHSKLKKELKGFPKLYHPKPEDHLIIETDASDNFWGGVLKARNLEGNEFISRYFSGNFQSAELNYHSNEKEYLAVLRTIKKFQIYLTPVRFTVRCDNKNFAYFLITNIAGRLVRWQQWFNHYNFDVEHIKGENNVLADSLSREIVPV